VTPSRLGTNRDEARAGPYAANKKSENRTQLCSFVVMKISRRSLHAAEVDRSTIFNLGVVCSWAGMKALKTDSSPGPECAGSCDKAAGLMRDSAPDDSAGRYESLYVAHENV